MVWRVSPAHKRLQVRMEHMRRFRRQHEQLRSVIVRVLRPSLTASKTDTTRTPDSPGVDVEGSENKQLAILDAADYNSIEVL